MNFKTEAGVWIQPQIQGYRFGPHIFEHYAIQLGIFTRERYETPVKDQNFYFKRY